MSHSVCLLHATLVCHFVSHNRDEVMNEESFFVLFHQIRRFIRFPSFLDIEYDMVVFPSPFKYVKQILTLLILRSEKFRDKMITNFGLIDLSDKFTLCK